MLKVYGIKNCNTVKKSLTWLETNKIPYEFLNRINRNKLSEKNKSLVSSISTNDYLLKNDHPENLDLFLILEK